MERWNNGIEGRWKKSKGLRVEEWNDVCPVKCDVGAICTGEELKGPKGNAQNEILRIFFWVHTTNAVRIA